MQARQSGVCVICRKAYAEGADISWIRHGSHRSRKYHVSCRAAMDDSDFLALLETLPPIFEGEDYSHGPRATVNEPISDGLDDILLDLEDETPAKPSDDVAKTLQAILKRLDALEGGKGVSAPQTRPEYPHERFDHVLYYVQSREHVYLYGAPGSGKSTLASQIADYLGWAYGYVALNPQTSEFRLLGFIDASGKYNATEFRRVYEHGGIFCIDEMDNANPSLLTTLNGLLENDLAAFPDGMVKRHENFVLVATGNTTGRGASRQFPDRRKFDAAFAERFVFLQVAYDELMEKRISLSINADSLKAVEWVQAVRRWAEHNAPEMIVSPRASYKLAKHMGNGCPLSGSELAEAVLFKGVATEVVSRCLRDNPIRRAF